MSAEFAKTLYESGRSHALSSNMLYWAAIRHAKAENIPDPELFAFNGTPSLSIHYLMGLGLELYLKAACVACGGDCGSKALRDIGHDLLRALEHAEAQGFATEAPRLREIVVHMREPYMAHYFRYERPKDFNLPDIMQVQEAFARLDHELEALVGR